MPNWLFIILISVSAVTVFVVGLSLSLIVRGRHIQSEIATNPNMQKLGITCTAESADCGEKSAAACSGECGSCQGL